MNPLAAVLGLALLAGAVLAVVLLVVVPPGPRIPAARRRAPGAVDPSTVTRFTDVAVRAVDRVLRRGGVTVFSETDLELAGISTSRAGFLLLVLCAAAVLAAFGVLLGGLTIASVVLAVVLAVAAPIGAKVLVSVRTTRRRSRFAEQLGDVLGLLSGGLRAGHSLLTAVDALSSEVEEPSGSEFTRVVNQTRLGRDVGEALLATANRMRSDDFRWVAQAVAINREAGGNLAEVLEQAAATIRERNEIRGQVRALSAEGRFSALILLALPVGVLLMLLIVRPSYFAGFFTSILGILAMAAAAVLMVLGALWMRVAIRVRF